MVEYDIRAFLLANSGVNALAQGFYPVRPPMTAPRPNLTYRRASGGHDHNMTGAAGSAIPNMELVAWGDDYDSAKNLAAAVRTAMEGFGPGTMGSSDVRSVALQDETDGFAYFQDGSDDGIYSVTLQYQIRYTESIPTP